MALLSPAADSWHVTKCNIHTAAPLAFPSWTRSLSPSHTQTLISESEPWTHVSLYCPLPNHSFIPPLHPFFFPENSPRLRWAFSFVHFFETTMLFVFQGAEQRDAAWQPLSLGRPCLLHVNLCASAVTSEGHYLPKASVCFGLIMGHYWGTSGS